MWFADLLKFIISPAMSFPRAHMLLPSVSPVAVHHERDVRGDATRGTHDRAEEASVPAHLSEAEGGGRGPERGASGSEESREGASPASASRGSEQHSSETAREDGAADGCDGTGGRGGARGGEECGVECGGGEERNNGSASSPNDWICVDSLLIRLSLRAPSDVTDITRNTGFDCNDTRPTRGTDRHFRARRSGPCVECAPRLPVRCVVC